MLLALHSSFKRLKVNFHDVELYLVFNNTLTQSIYQLLLDTLPEFRLIAIAVEDLKGVYFTDEALSINDLNKGCYMCPRKEEVGDHHHSMDGCFNLPRREKAGKIHKLPHLKGLIRERLLYDTLVPTEEALLCNTVLINNQLQKEQREAEKVLLKSISND